MFTSEPLSEGQRISICVHRGPRSVMKILFVQHQICFVSTIVRIKSNRTKKTLTWFTYFYIACVWQKKGLRVTLWELHAFHIVHKKNACQGAYICMSVCIFKLTIAGQIWWNVILTFTSTYRQTRHPYRRSFRAHYASNSVTTAYSYFTSISTCFRTSLNKNALPIIANFLSAPSHKHHEMTNNTECLKLNNLHYEKSRAANYHTRYATKYLLNNLQTVPEHTCARCLIRSQLHWNVET